MQINVKNNLIIVCFIAALGGLLFGMDMGFLNGSLELIKEEMHLTTASVESFAGILLIGAIAGALCSGFLSRAIGRQKTIILAALFFSIFTFSGSLTSSFSFLYFTRFCIGLSIGCASFVVPIYLSEVSPYQLRGAIVAMFQLMVTVGIFVIFLTNSIIRHYYNSWRLMLGIISIPSICMLIGMFFTIESPRWFMLKGKKEEAKKTLERIRENPNDINFELKEIEESIKKETENKVSGWTLLNRKFFLKVLILGILIQLLNTLTGINSIIYYSGIIFNFAGFTNPAVSTIIIGLINVLATAFAMRYIDKWGRKPIIYFGFSVMMLSLITISYIMGLKDNISALSKFTMLTACIMYIIAYAVSLGIIGWALCTEIFPLEGRDFGVTVTTVTNYLFNTIVVSTSLTIMEKLGPSALFLIFAGFCSLGIFITVFFIPETKGVSLEEIEINLKNGIKLRNLGVWKR